MQPMKPMQPMQPMQFHATGHPADAGGIDCFGVLGSACRGLGLKCVLGAHSAIREPRCGGHVHVAWRGWGHPRQLPPARKPSPPPCAPCRAGIAPTARRHGAFLRAASAPALPLATGASTAVLCAVLSKALIYLSEATQSSDKRLQRWNEAPPIYMHATIGDMTLWTAMAWWQMAVHAHAHAWRRMVVCGGWRLSSPLA